MELTIDSKPCDLAGEPIAVGGYAAAELADVEAAREGRSQELTLPATPRNEALLGFARDPHTAGRFNASLHRAVLSAEGAKLLAGTVRLLEASGEGYRIEIREGGARWAKNAARRMLGALGIDYHARLLPSTVSDSWTDDSPVKFFPIRRDEYPQQNSPSDLLPAERILSVDDYHPFLHVATLVETIFAEAGYRIESNFTGSPEFRSLYMSGAYPSRDTAALAARMGFYARRLAPATAQGNHLGRVSANPSTTANSVGNIVETATPQTLDTDGEPIPELCNNGNCFGFDKGRIVFTPTTEVSAGFEYYLKYTTDHRILTRERLRGFDSVYLGTGADMPFTLANRYEDHRPDISPGHRYLAIVFDHTDGAQYRLAYTKDGVAEALWTEFSARTAQVTTPASGTVADPVLLIRSGTRWIRYTGDWALYDGYVTESGRTTVELRVRTAPERIAPASPKFFDRIYFYGAEEGMSLTLHKECSLRPRFSSAPGYGSAITFADVARHPIRQSALLEALQHLFNLRFHTEEETKTVRIEPADEFFGSGTTADWRDRSDFSQPVVLADIAPEIHESRTWGYQEGDGAVNRFNAGAGSPFGASAPIPMPHERATKYCATPSSGPRSARQGTMPTPPRRRSCRSATGMTCRRTAPTSRPVSCASPGCTRCPRANAGVSVGAGGIPARGIPLHGGRSDGGLHALFRRPRRHPRPAPSLRPPGSTGSHLPAHHPLAAARAARIRKPLHARHRDARPAFGIPARHRGRGNPRHAPCYRKLRPAGGIGQMHLHTPERRMMTRHEKRLAEVLLDAIGGLEGEQAVERLFGLGLVNLRACEQRAVRARVDRLAEEGVPRCEAMHVTADEFCCSYEKVRSYYYNTYKS